MAVIEVLGEDSQVVEVLTSDSNLTSAVANSVEIKVNLNNSLVGGDGVGPALIEVLRGAPGADGESASHDDIWNIINTATDDNRRFATSYDIKWRSPYPCTLEVRDGFQAPALTSGTIIAGLIIAEEPGTYTRIRCFITSGGTGITGIKMGIWGKGNVGDGVSPTDVLITETPNLAGQQVSGAWLTGTLNTPITLSSGDEIYAGISARGGSALVNIRGISLTNAQWPQTHGEGRIVYVARGANTWTSDTDPLTFLLVTNIGPGAIPLIQLLP